MILIYIIFFLFFIITVILLSKIKIEIKEANTTKINKIEKYNIDFSLYFFGIKYFKININEKNGKKGFKSKILNKILQKSKKKSSKERLNNGLELIKLLKIEKINLIINYGIDSVILNTYVTVILSTVISIVLNKKIEKYDKNKIKYKIIPYYINKNFINFNLDCIIFTKTTHIIRIIIKNKRSECKNGRTSNRKFNVNSYG